MKNYFSILSLPKIVERIFCVLTLAAGCSSYFMKTRLAKETHSKFVLSPSIQYQKNPGPLQTEAQGLTVQKDFNFSPDPWNWLSTKKVLCKTLPWNTFSGLTADDMNNALLIFENQPSPGQLLWNFRAPFCSNLFKTPSRELPLDSRSPKLCQK